jgi:hypothetical protein
MPSKYLANNRKKKAMRIKGTITYTTSVRTNLSIAASQFQKKYFLLQIEIPKKDPRRPSGGSTRIEIRQ